MAPRPDSTPRPTRPRDWHPFTRAVVVERARLALYDDEGEAEAVAPLSHWRAWQLIHAVAALDAPRPRLRDLPKSPTDQYDNDAVLEALGVTNAGRGSGMIRCPAHEDRRPSLSWRLAGDKLLLRCFAGCQFADILAAVA